MENTDWYEKTIQSFNKVNWNLVAFTIASAEIIKCIEEELEWTFLVDKLEKY